MTDVTPAGELVPIGAPVAEWIMSDDAREAVGKGTPDSTRRAYKGDWDRFAAWCAERGIQPLPASGEVLAEYMTWLCYRRPVTDRRGNVVPGKTGVALATARRALAAICKAHRVRGMGRPWTDGATEVIKGYEQELAGRRDPRARPRGAVAMTPEHLAALSGPGLAGEQELIRLRDAAMFYLDRHAATRASEIVLIDIADVAEVAEGLEITVRRVKTREFESVKIPADAAPQTVKVIRHWITVLAEHGWTSGPLFPRIDKAGVIGASPREGSPDGRMTTGSAQRRIRWARENAGLGDERITFHSGRRGFATAARMAGHDKLAIARHGGWKDDSKAVDVYIEDADSWRLNPLRGAGI